MRSDPLQQAFTKAVGYSRPPCLQCGGPLPSGDRNYLAYAWDLPPRCEACGRLLSHDGVPLGVGAPEDDEDVTLLLLDPGPEEEARLRDAGTHFAWPPLSRGRAPDEEIGS